MEPTHRRRRTERVIEHIVGGIRDGTFAAGQRLPSERSLAEALGISRPLIREALMYVNRAGLVHTRHGSGTYVMPLLERYDLVPGNLHDLISGDPRVPVSGAPHIPNHLNNLRWVFELRLAIETQTAAYAAQRADSLQLVQIGQALDQLHAGVVKAKLAAEADFQFHVAVAKASNNPYLLEVLTNAADRLIESVTVNRTRSMAVRELPAEVELEHRAVYKFIAERDPVGASDAMRHHLLAAWRRFLPTRADMTVPRPEDTRWSEGLPSAPVDVDARLREDDTFRVCE